MNKSNLTKINFTYSLNNIQEKETISIERDESLEAAFYKYSKNKNLLKNKQISFYLLKDKNKISLDKNILIKDLNVKEDDSIFVSFYGGSRNNKEQNELTHNVANSSTDIMKEEIDSESTMPKSKKKFWTIFITIAIILVTLSICLILYKILSNKANKGNHKIKNDNNNNKINDDSDKNNNKNNTDESNNNNNNENKTDEININKSNKVYYPEILINNIKPYYPNDTLFLYRSEKSMEIIIETKAKEENVNDTNNSTNTKIKEYMDFGLIINESNIENDDRDNLTKKWYTGYITVLNITINNGTEDVSLSYNNKLHELINENNNNQYVNNNLRNLKNKKNSRILTEENEICFVKIDFYENGEIKNIYTPEGFKNESMVYIDIITKYIIPKFSKKLYTKNINEKIKEIYGILEGNYDTEEEEEFDEENLKENNNENIFENENIDNNNLLLRKTSQDNNNDINRALSEKEKEKEIDIDDSLYLNNNISNTDSVEYEDYIPNIKTENFNSSNDESSKLNLKGIYQYKDYSEIIDFDIERIQSAQAKLEGSNLQRIKNTFLDEKNMLSNIIESENFTISQPDNDSLSELTEEEKKLKSEIYDDNNAMERDDEQKFMGNDVSFDLSDIITKNENKISLYKNINNKELTKKLFSFFEKFKYTKYNEENNEEEKKLRVLKNIKDNFMEKNKDFNSSQIEVSHTLLNNKNKIKRKLKSSNSYYGMKNFVQEKILFKYNLIGLILEGIIVSKIDVSKGTTDNYFKLNIGFINLDVNFESIQTNLHIIIKNSHLMTYNLLGLLFNSNEDLITRNKIYSDIIINLEKNVSKLLENYYDYSGLFRDSLDYLYDQVKNFSGDFFNELIDVIEMVYDNYTIILNKTENYEYDFIINIANITQREYMNYINNMFELVVNFQNSTLIFLSNLQKKVNESQIFQLDVLYDIIDILYDSKSFFKEFNQKLFKAVDRGVTTFKYDLRDYIEETIGDLLYLTDFLSVNINKNEILKFAINDDTKKRITIKLKNFRNIILRILEILNNNIINDYEKEMSINNKNSIRYSKEDMIINIIEEIEEKSEQIIQDIKNKIDFINYYETYANNIQIINNINNKTYTEFNMDMFSILNDIKKIKPEFFDKNSELVNNKKYLFSLSNELINIINKDINELNNYVESYTSNYFFENNYNYDYNIYNFKNYFTDVKFNSLVHEFKIIVEDAIKIYYSEVLNRNYELAFEYLNDVKDEFLKIKHTKIFGKVFNDTYNKFLSIFNEFSGTLVKSRYDFQNYINNSFCNVSNYILNYINNRIKTINKYYFNEINNENFLKLELFEEEIYKISNNINDMFNSQIFAKEEFIIQKVIDDKFETMSTLITDKQTEFINKFKDILGLSDDKTLYDNGCEIVKVVRIEDRKWWSLWLYYEVFYEYYCDLISFKRSNTYSIVKQFPVPKKFLDEKFDKLMKNYINEFDKYLNNIIQYSKNLYSNLYYYMEEKINNNNNLNMILNDYKNIFNNIIKNNTKEKIVENIFLNYPFDYSKIRNIISILEDNLFKMYNEYYLIYYLKDKNYFLEYPDEIILKLNQSLNNLKSNSDIIKNKINLSFNTRLKNIISSTKLFITNINKFNLEYIKLNINKDSIYEEYFNTKYNFLKDFFDSILNLDGINNKIVNESYLNLENYDSLINNIEEEYSAFIYDFITEIDTNFTTYKCIENDDSIIYENYSDLINSDINGDDIDLNSDLIIKNRNCTKEKYSTELNYSKYNFNIVKFRTELSNDKTFLEVFNSLFNDLNYNTSIDSNEINDIDKVLNNDKNILYIYDKTKYQSKKIKEYFINNTQENFDTLVNEIMIKKIKLNDKYTEFLKLYKETLNLKNKLFYQNISEENNLALNELNILLEQLNSSLVNNLNDIINKSINYDYYTIVSDNNYILLFNEYYSRVNNIFNNLISKFQNFKTNNIFYSIPRKILNELFVEIRNNITSIIDQYSYNFDFNSIGFRYNISEEFEIYFKKYYINYDFNNTYEYFELIENNSNNYINEIIQKINYLKNEILNKLNIIINNFKINVENVKRRYNYVKNDYIEQIEMNNTICLNSLSNLYSNISYELDNKNITSSENYINNNCSIEGIEKLLLNNAIDDICLNISEINDTLIYFNKNKKILSECNNNNNYNYSYLKLEIFDSEEKKDIDDIISDIIDTIKIKSINENNLINYSKENFINANMSLDLDINDFMTKFEKIETDSSNVNTSNETEYKNLMYNISIESFNISYSNNVISLISELINNEINLIINDKFDIFINYYSNKIKNDFIYYRYLLSQFDELGNSSKISLMNLFVENPRKLKDSIYSFIEEDIYDYINTYFRENKNIFINNFIQFYLEENKEKHFNLNIYEINGYINELLADKNFNKTLNNITSYFINQITTKIKENINNTIISKINLFISESESINIKLKKDLNKINTTELTEDMKALLELVNNYEILLNKQNSKYNFSIGEKPLYYLNIFIKEELEPSLSLISEKYNYIEEELINKIQPLAENFPDCVSEIKKNLIAEKMNLVDNFKEEINITLLEYEDILMTEIQNYMNKLIHYTYIDGLETVTSSCENDNSDLDCGININSLRNLEQKDLLTINKVYKGHPIFENISEKYKEKYNNINNNFKQKRRLSSFPEYTSDMGALTEDNIIYYISELQNTILKLNKTYFGKEYSKIFSNSNKFFNKINYTYLEKLKLSFDTKLSKFSTILTKDSIKKVERIILRQYYQIEQYVHESSDLFLIKINNFLNKIDNSYGYTESLSGYVHNQVLGYYNILYTTIQDKYQEIEHKINFHNIIDSLKSLKETVKDTKNIIEGHLGEFHIELKYNVNFTYLLSKIFKKSEKNNKEKNEKKKSLLSKLKGLKDIKKEKKFEVTFAIPFGCPNLQIRITPGVIVGFGSSFTIKPDFSNFKFNLTFDIYVEAKVTMRFEGGLYIPPNPQSKIQTAMVAGLEGVVGHGRVGLNLNFVLLSLETEFDVYFIFNAFQFQFYFLSRVKIDTPFLQMEYTIDIVRTEIEGFHYEQHCIKNTKNEVFKQKKIGRSEIQTKIGELN